MASEKYLIYLFVIVFVFMPLYVWSFWRRKILLRRYAEDGLLAKVNVESSLARSIVKSILLCLAFGCVVIALCRPRWDPVPREIKKQGRDVIILLDVSKSMLAEDVAPNRLERAKLAIRDLIEELEGDRVGLVTFAGRASVKCPLTQDYAFLRLALEDIDVDSAGAGGTNLGDAIRKASAEVFDNKVKEYKDIVLISDGGDLKESLPVEAAKDAAEKGVRIIAVGLGDEDVGSRIPVYDRAGNKTFLVYEGNEVWTKLEGQQLREVALSTPEGKYMPVGCSAFDLGELYVKLIASAEKTELEATIKMDYKEGFQYFIVVAIVLLVVEMFTSERKKSVRV